nr:MAG TPA: hypothetical protein [Caudoviricetes sp.]
MAKHTIFKIDIKINNIAYFVILAWLWLHGRQGWRFPPPVNAKGYLKMDLAKLNDIEIMDIGNNRDVIWQYYLSTLRGFEGYSRLYLNINNGEIFESYEVSQNTWLEADNIVQICGTSALGGVGLSDDELATLEDWADEWFDDWYNGYFRDALIAAVDSI